MLAFNATDAWTLVSAIIGSPIITTYLVKKFGKPAEQKIEQVVKNDGPVIVNALKDAGHAIEDLLKIPELAPLKAELLAKEKSLKESELVKYAGVALHAYEKSFDALSQNEKGTLITLVRTELAKVHITVTDTEILNALRDVQSLSDGFKNSQVYKATVALEQSLKALVEVQPSA